MTRSIVRTWFGLLVIGLLAVTAMPSAALAAPGDQLWAAKFSTGGNHTDSGYAVAVSPDGTRVFVTGAIRFNSAYMTIAYDAATGAQLWQAQWFSTYPVNGVPADIVVGPLGNRVYVTGEIGNGQNYDFGTVAYDAATGARIWRKRYNGPAAGDDRASALALSPDGHTLYVTGESDGTGRSAATTIAYDSKSGAQEWISRLTPGRTQNGFSDITVSADGSRLYAAGESGTKPAVLVAKMDAANGHAVWTKTFKHPGDQLDSASRVALTPDGSTLVVGATTISSGSNFDWATIAYDPATGARRWTRTVDRGQGDVLTGLAMSPTGQDVAVSGWLSPHQADAGTIVYRVDTGAVVWQRAYDDPVHGFDFANAVAYSPDGSTVYITGQGDVAGGVSQFLTIAYDAAKGDKEWLRRSRNRGPVPGATAYAIAVNPNGSAVYVTGTRDVNARDSDFLTIAFAA
jgi:DNA-binding beta-propeller fold protein YncE